MDVRGFPADGVLMVCSSDETAHITYTSTALLTFGK